MRVRGTFLFKVVDSMAQYDGAIRIVTKITTRDAEESLSSLEWKIKKSAKEIDSLRSKMDALKGQKIPTKEWENLQKELSTSEKELSDLIAKQNEWEKMGISSGGAWDSLNDDIANASDNIDSIKEKMQALVDAGKNFQLGENTEQYKAWERQVEYEEEAIVKAGEHYTRLKEGTDEVKKMSAAYKKYLDAVESARNPETGMVSMRDASKLTLGYVADSMKERMENLGASLKNAVTHPIQAMRNAASRSFEEVGDSAEKSLGKVNKSAKKSGGLLSVLIARFKGLALSLLIFNQISKAFNAMMSGIHEGIGNLARYSNPVNAALSSLKSSLTQLKNSFATAFAPILTTVAPILTTFISMISRAVTYVGMLIAALTGQKAFTKATAVQEKYAESLGDTASGAKEANKQLSSLDKLNNLSSNSGGGGGGGGGGVVSPEDMFETVPIENEIIGFAERIKKVLADMFAPLKEAWNIYGDSIKGTLSQILQDFIDFGVRIGNATYEWFKNLNWEPLLSAVDNLLRNLEPLIDLILDGLAWAYENVLLPFGKWTIEEAIPAVLNLVAEAFRVLNEVLVALEPLGTWLWESFLQPLGEWAGDVIIDALETITDLLGKFGDWVSEHQEAVQNMAIIVGSFFAAFTLVTAISNIVSFIASMGGLIGIVQSMAGLIGSVFNPWVLAIGAIIAIGVLLYKNWDEISAKAKEVWDFVKQKFQEFDEYLKNIFTHDWSQEFGIIGDVINGFNKTIEHVWNAVKRIFGGIIDFVAGVFTGDWERAWSGIVNIFGGIWDGLVGIIKAPANAIIGIVNGLIRGVAAAVNSIANMLNGLRIDIPSWVPGIGGGKLGFNLPTWTPPQIPYLAQGAVIPANKEFLAVLGDQKHGRNLEAPEDLIRQIVREESANAGGAREITVKVPVEIDGRVLFEIIQKLDMEQFRRTQRPSFQM